MLKSLEKINHVRVNVDQSRAACLAWQFRHAYRKVFYPWQLQFELLLVHFSGKPKAE